DGEPAESAPGIPHTSFRLNPSGGVVALSRRQGSPLAPAVLDYLAWEEVPGGRSLGSIPDGEPRARRILFHPTPGAANDPAVPVVNVVLNEFMAQNTRTLADPADGDWDDWIELYNSGPNPVDLTGYHLTDNLTNSLAAMFRIPAGYPLPPGGRLLVWADGETSQNSPTNSGLHVDFALARTGEQIGLFDPAGTVVDSLTYGAQTPDVSTGRFPDGAPPPLYPFETPTPGSANLLAGANRPPAFDPVADRVVPEQSLVAFTVRAVDPDPGQTIRYSLGPDAPPGATLDPVTGAFRWPTAESDGPATYSVLLRATDDGSPARVGILRFNLTVQEVNLPPVVVAVTNVAVAEGVLLSLALPASDPDRPANTLSFSPAGPLPDGAALSPAGLLTWTPDESRGGAGVSILYRVTDNGVPPLSVTGEVRVTVAEVNNPPVFAQPSPATVDEGSAFALQLSASDPEGAAVRFRIDGAAPAGFQLDSLTGNVGWTPTEDQGPGSYVILIRATESSPEQLSVVRELLVTVREVNRRPVLDSLTPRVVREGATLRLGVLAADADRPAQALRFSLDPGAPAGASIDPGTGAFQWTVPDDFGATTNDLVVRVTDDGPGALEATAVLRVVTEPRFRVVINEILRRPAAPGTEFIELLNPSAVTAWNLDGFRLTGSNLTYHFPANTRLAPGGAVVVAANVAAFRAAFGPGPAVSGAWTGSLGAAADSLALLLPGAGGGPDT
ncbi:MAG: lamin tail domain-containing protein, partial [Verrucomicrobiota bacterium]